MMSIFNPLVSDMQVINFKRHSSPPVINIILENSKHLNIVKKKQVL